VTSLSVYCCSKLTEISNLEKANFVHFVDLESLADFSFLSKVYAKVVIEECCGFIKNRYESILNDIPLLNL
jgi:hypothetical protein